VKRFRSVATKIIRSSTGETFSVPDTQGTFGNLRPGEHVYVDTNLPEPRQHLALFSREFLAVDILGDQRGVREMPYGFDIELTGVSTPAEHKYISVHYAMLPNADIAEKETGVSPIRTTISLRKEANITSSNKSILSMTFKDFAELQKQGRLMLVHLQSLEGKTFESFEGISLPKDVVIRIKPDEQSAPKSIVVLSASLVRRQKDQPHKRVEGHDAVLPILNIREYVENKRQQHFVATSKGFSIGLRGFYMLMYPCSMAIKQYHDMYLQVCFYCARNFIENLSKQE